MENENMNSEQEQVLGYLKTIANNVEQGAARHHALESIVFLMLAKHYTGQDDKAAAIEKDRKILVDAWTDAGHQAVGAVVEQIYKNFAAHQAD